ncbi:MAG TPA: hypothetical protein VK479_04360 [Micropepsaceae bacterium]|nr:hypothetical protein [Micropepsaceae bacterium]
MRANPEISAVLVITGFVSVAIVAWPASGAENASPLPEFAGPWARNAFNFEPMASGPVPLVNLKRLADGTGDAGQLVGDYKNPILKPEVAEIVKKKGEISISGEAYPDPSNHCAPYAPPFNFAMQLGMQILEKKDALTIIYNQDDQVRHVRMNGSHPTRVTPSAMGDSVGHYEGDTLVIDTVGIATGHPYTVIDRYGTPHSEALHVVERYRLIDGAAAKEAQDVYEKREGRVGGVPGAMLINPDTNLKGLQVQVTVEDPKVFTTPWSANVTYRRGRGAWQEQVCAENPVDYQSGKRAAVPQADKPDF